MLKNRKQKPESLLVSNVRETIKLIEKMASNCRTVVVEVSKAEANYKKVILREELKKYLCISATLIKKEPAEFLKIARKSVLIKSKEEYKIAEGQITGMSEFYIQLKTADMESRFEIGTKLWEELQKEKVTVGDVVKIYKDTGFVIKTGRALAIDNTNIKGDLIKIPTGEILKNEVQETVLSLDQIDLLNSEKEAMSDFYSNKKVSKSVQIETDCKITRWLREEKVSVEFLPLCIENCELADEKTFLKILQMSKILENQLKLIFLFDGSVHEFYAGIPKISMKTPTREEVSDYLALTIVLKKAQLEPSAADSLASIALDRGLKTALSILDLLGNSRLITVSHINDLCSTIGY
ncbi:hypothetical protein NUSPORA_00945 [Nucleospora cyclopteri]